MLEARTRLRVVFAAWLAAMLCAAGLYLAGELEGARMAAASFGTLTPLLVDLARVARALSDREGPP